MTSQLLELGRRTASPASARAQAPARLHLFDAAVAALAGATTREGAATARYVENQGACPRETLAADLVLTLARRIRATELDDLQLESVTTAAAAVVPALVGAVAIAGKREYCADDVLSAMTAGYDIMHTLGLAVGGADFLYRQGAGLASSRLVQPPPRRRADCLASIPRRSRTPSRWPRCRRPRSLRGSGEDGRWLSFGLAVTAGFHAALAVAQRLARRPAPARPGSQPRRELRRPAVPGLPAVLARPWKPGAGWPGSSQAVGVSRAGRRRHRRGRRPGRQAWLPGR